MSGRPKTGAEHFEVIKADIEYIKTTYGAFPNAWVTDDGPDGKKARREGEKLWNWMIFVLCWAHQINLLVGDYLVLADYRTLITQALDVIKWFNNHEGALTLLRLEQTTARPLNLLLPVLTRWTTHYHAITRLVDLQHALYSCSFKHKTALQKIADNARTKEAKELGMRAIETIGNGSFWSELKRYAVRRFCLVSLILKYNVMILAYLHTSNL